MPPGTCEPVEPSFVPPQRDGGFGTLLVVDDDATVRTVTARALQACGFTVLLAADGAEGIEVFRAHQREIVLILLDLTMPGLDGEATFLQIRAASPDARVILMTGYSEEEELQRFAGRGLAGFVQKPYRVSELREAVFRAIA